MEKIVGKFTRMSLNGMTAKICGASTAALFTAIIALSPLAQLEARGDRGIRQSGYDGKDNIAENHAQTNRAGGHDKGFPQGNEHEGYERGYQHGYNHGYEHGYNHGYQYGDRPYVEPGLGVGVNVGGVGIDAGVNVYEPAPQPNVYVPEPGVNIYYGN